MLPAIAPSPTLGDGPPRIGYILKVYPRFSETFIVTEILAHEAAGLPIEIFSLRPPTDGHFQDTLGQVQAPVHYVPSGSLKATDLWSTMARASTVVPNLWAGLEAMTDAASDDLYQAIWLAEAAHRYRITHWHAHFATTAATVARLAAHLTGLPYTLTAHANDIFHQKVDVHDLRHKLAEAAAVITVSDYNVDYLRSQYGAAADRVQRIYNGLDLTRFPFAEPTARPPRIAAVGRLVEKKGFADLIDACGLLHARGHRFECRIIGTGELAGPLAEQIERLGLTGIVELAGPRPQAATIAEIQAAAMLVAPCVVGEDGNRDGLPTVLLEAMALGTPCIATDVTGIPELITHDVTGLLVPQHSPTALAVAIETLLSEPSRRRQLADSARQLIEREYNITQNAARLREVFASAQHRLLAALGGSSRCE